MPSAAEVKGRIKSIEDTRKITNAMYLVASTKLRRAKNDLERTRPYFYALRNEIKRIFRTVRDVESRYLLPSGGRTHNRRYFWMSRDNRRQRAGRVIQPECHKKGHEPAGKTFRYSAVRGQENTEDIFLTSIISPL